jgi:hypothetical protein
LQNIENKPTFIKSVAYMVFQDPQFTSKKLHTSPVAEPYRVAKKAINEEQEIRAATFLGCPKCWIFTEVNSSPALG